MVSENSPQRRKQQQHANRAQQQTQEQQRQQQETQQQQMQYQQQQQPQPSQPQFQKPSLVLKPSQSPSPSPSKSQPQSARISQSVSKSSFPGEKSSLSTTEILSAASDASLIHSSYEFDEMADVGEEIEALEAIFGPEASRVDVLQPPTNAWHLKTRPQRRLVLIVASESIPVTSFSASSASTGTVLESLSCAVELAVEFGPKYPFQPPRKLTVSAVRGITAAQEIDLQLIAESRAKQLVGTVVVFEVAETLREALEGINAARALPSAFDNMLASRLHAESESNLQHEMTHMQEQDQDAIETLELQQAITNELRIKKEKAKILRNEKKTILLNLNSLPNASSSSSSSNHNNNNNGNLVSSAASYSSSASPTSDSINLSTVFRQYLLFNSMIAAVYHASPFPPSVLHTSTTSPRLSNNSGANIVPLMIHAITFRNPYYHTTEARKNIDAVVSLIHRQSKLAPHPSIQQVFDARFSFPSSTPNESQSSLEDQQKPTTPTLSTISSTSSSDILLEILVEASGGSSGGGGLMSNNLDALIKQAGNLSLHTASSYIKRVLKGLAHLHAYNFVHTDINCQNMLFFGTPDQIEIKLSGGEYSRKLLDMHATHPIASTLRTETAFPDGWRPPESMLRKPVYGRKGDVWCVARSFCHMVFGERIFREYSGPRDFIDGLVVARMGMPDVFVRFLERVFDDDTVERPGALEVLKDDFFGGSSGAAGGGGGSVGGVNGGDLSAALSIEVMRQRFLGGVNAVPPVASSMAAAVGVAGNGIPGLQTMHASTVPMFASGLDLTASRYHTDFEEVDFLGKGGFGSVVKARNRIDNRFYAVKKIKVDSQKGSGVKLLREVQTLSRLHHHHIVRYYQAWYVL
ncbi:hypothetical protein HK100_005158 [Physocladia obscura]|uniref:Uncharacterized protein n=1 Tax=Physocladia obscura TaxID=109957 RepID=A0AAD5SS15_9FUNG|nr:hypothetical protein HK100_005158 [Physocladia obscura]